MRILYHSHTGSHSCSLVNVHKQGMSERLHTKRRIPFAFAGELQGAMPGKCRPWPATKNNENATSLLLSQCVRQPVEPFVETVACGCHRRLDVPLTVAHVLHTKLLL